MPLRARPTDVYAKPGGEDSFIKVVLLAEVHVSILIPVYKRLLADIVVLSGVSLDAPDEITMDWVLKEGPMLDKQILMYLEGSASQPILPQWLAPLWGRFVITNDASYLRYLRQLLVFCYKAEYEPTKEQLEDANHVFEETDDMVGVWTSAFLRGPNFIQSTARQIVTSVVREIARQGKFKNICPAHGPGAVFPPRKPCEKSRFLTLYRPIVEYYPYDQFFCGIPSFWTDVMVDGRNGELSEKDEIVANLIAVPKDSRGPRLICVHPAESIWIQQGQRQVLEAAIDQFPLTRGKINFTDQSVNGRLALSSSLSRELVTLDLKEASDRMGSELVRYLFGETVYGWISCSRATKVKLLDGRVITLQKWAPMGNALTFPVQSLVFWALVYASIVSRYGQYCDEIYVFGDDILYPVKYHEGVLEGLVSSGLVPNMAKTFKAGFFRESCGVDAYNGIDITPLRAKKQGINSTQDAVSYLDLAKRLRIGGYECCATFIYYMISNYLGYKLPISNNPDSAGFVEYMDIDWVQLMLREPSMRFRRTVHTWAVPSLMVKSCNDTRYTCDWYHIQDSLLRLAHMGDKISDRGTEYSLPYRARLKYGWTDCIMK
jgi:hypothetical protein